MANKESCAGCAALAARVAAIESTSVVRKSLTTERAQAQITESAVAAEQKRATAAAAKAAAESAMRERRLAEAEKVATESAWIRLSAPRGWSSTYPLPANTRNYRTIQSHGSHELSADEWRRWLATDSAGELLDAIAAGDLVISPLPANWGQLDRGEQLRDENAWRSARVAR